MIKCPSCENELDQKLEECTRCGCPIEFFTNKDDFDDYTQKIVKEFKTKWEEKKRLESAIVNIIFDEKLNCAFIIDEQVNQDGFASYDFFDFSGSKIYDVGKFEKLVFLEESKQKFKSIKIRISDWDSLLLAFQQNPFAHERFLAQCITEDTAMISRFNYGPEKKWKHGNWDYKSHSLRIRQLHDALLQVSNTTFLGEKFNTTKLSVLYKKIDMDAIKKKCALEKQELKILETVSKDLRKGKLR